MYTQHKTPKKLFLRNEVYVAEFTEQIINLQPWKLCVVFIFVIKFLEERWLGKANRC